MRPELKNKLDKQLRKDRNTIIYAFFGVFLFLATIALIYFPLTSESVNGKLLGMNMQQTEMGSYPLLRVELESGKVIIARAGKNFVFKQGNRVEIMGGKPYLGKTIYRFVRYVP